MSSGFVAAGIVGSGAHFGLYVDILEAFMKSEILDGCSPEYVPGGTPCLKPETDCYDDRRELNR